jgi:hypothetical protein
MRRYAYYAVSIGPQAIVGLNVHGIALRDWMLKGARVGAKVAHN